MKSSVEGRGRGYWNCSRHFRLSLNDAQTSGVALRAEGGRQQAPSRKALLAPWVLSELKTALLGVWAGV